MKRPTMKENLKGYSLKEAHKLYTDCPELYRYIVKLDKYIDNLEDELNIPVVSGSIRTDVNGDIHKSDEYIDGDQDCYKCKYYNTYADLPPCSKCELGESEYYR